MPSIGPQEYIILPFKFERFEEDVYLLVNIVGEHYFIDKDSYSNFVKHTLLPDSSIYHDLKSKNFLANDNLAQVINQLSIKYRTKKQHLQQFTSLHMVVVTARCNHSCRYCQASSGGADELGLDMSIETASNVVDFIFKSPSPAIKIEFQGGEPLLNFGAIMHIVNRATQINKTANKQLTFVIATNLTELTEHHLKFIKRHSIFVSTSLDGPKDVHDTCRHLRDSKDSSYDLFVAKLTRARDVLGCDALSALMTTTKYNLGRINDVVDEYIKNGFGGIFLRSLNPYGRALIDKYEIDYSIDEFVEHYKNALHYIIDLNLRGVRFEEYYSKLILQRILTPFSTAFVDLQSPTGAGLMGVIYDYNGIVYPADEGRMLARAGDDFFNLGNVNHDNYMSIFSGQSLRSIVSKTCVEVLPQCADCVYSDYCGSDPIRYYEECRDIVGHRPTSDFCRKNKAIIRFIMELIRDNNPEVMNVLWSWITSRSLDEIT